MSPFGSGEIALAWANSSRSWLENSGYFSTSMSRQACHSHTVLPSGVISMNGVAVHAAVGMQRAGDAAGDALLDLRRHHLPAEEDGVAVRQPAEIVMLADVLVLPQHLAVPVVFAEQPAAAAHVLRPFGKPAGPQQIAVSRR